MMQLFQNKRTREKQDREEENTKRKGDSRGNTEKKTHILKTSA